MAMTTTSKPVPAGYAVHREGTAEILVEARDGEDDKTRKNVFINPIQEFNRDLSVAAIRAWSELLDEEKKQAWLKKMQRKAEQGNQSKKRKIADTAEPEQPKLSAEAAQPQAFDASRLKYNPYKFTLYEGLSATGLRSIRYAKEIPSLKWVQANDLSSKAAEAIRRNVEWNDLGPPNQPEQVTAETAENEDSTEAAPLNGEKWKPRPAPQGMMRVSEGDCCSVLYAHRADKDRFDVVDLDPYGTAAPFIDGAVQAVSDGGLLCVTCTDLAVLAGTNYPEKCYSNYGGLPVKAEYTHEMALRILLHTIASSAARYGRYIVPMLSLSIDYYVRVFVRVFTGAAQVKKLASQTSLVYNCNFCHSTHLQSMGKVIEKKNQVNGNVNVHYGFATGPPCSSHCEQCGQPFHLSGPIWAGPLHDTDFCDRLLKQAETGPSELATLTRIKGMVTIAKEELHIPFYYIPAKVASHFHSSSPSLTTFASALLNAGYKVSRSHAAAGSIKTDAPNDFVFDIMREWIKKNPIKLSNIKEGSPTRNVIAVEQKHEVDLKYDKNVEKALLTDIKLVRYQQNPTADWGPQKRAKGGDSEASGKKRKHADQ